MKVRNWVLTGVMIVLFLGGVGFLIVNHLSKTHPTMARKMSGPIPVRVAVAKQTNMTEILGAPGESQAVELVTLTSGVSARVEKVLVDIGEIVSPGEVLIQFDRELLNATLKIAQSELNQAKDRLKLAKENLEWIKGIYDKGLSKAMLNSAQSEVDRTAGELERAEQNYRRIKAIYDQKLLPKVEIEKAKAEIEKAKADYSKAEEILLRTKKDLKEEVDKAKAEIEMAKADYNKAEEKLIRARKGIEKATITSPVSGVIMERLVNIGETPRENQGLIVIGRIDKSLVETKVSEDRVGAVHLNQPAIVTFTAFPNDVMEGEVVKIKPAGDPKTKTFLVYVKMENPDLKLKPGLTAFVRLRKEYQALAIPSVSLINPTGLQESSVFALENGLTAKLKKVKVGMSAEGMTEIIEGLSEGDKVVVVGQVSLKDGDMVRIGDEFDDVKRKYAEDTSTNSNEGAGTH